MIVGKTLCRAYSYLSKPIVSLRQRLANSVNQPIGHKLALSLLGHPGIRSYTEAFERSRKNNELLKRFSRKKSFS
ncbi:hypothetical protein ACFL52_03620 [Candidatus Margulisiibacteriota bacterium]